MSVKCGEEVATHESVARNKVIAKALDWAGYVERSGHGTEFIIEKCEAQGRPISKIPMNRPSSTPRPCRSRLKADAFHRRICR